MLRKRYISLIHGCEFQVNENYCHLYISKDIYNYVLGNIMILIIWLITGYACFNGFPMRSIFGNVDMYLFVIGFYLG